MYMPAFIRSDAVYEGMCVGLCCYKLLIESLIKAVHKIIRPINNSYSLKQDKLTTSGNIDEHSSPGYDVVNANDRLKLFKTN